MRTGSLDLVLVALPDVISAFKVGYLIHCLTAYTFSSEKINF